MVFEQERPSFWLNAHVLRSAHSDVIEKIKTPKFRHGHAYIITRWCLRSQRFTLSVTTEKTDDTFRTCL